MIAQRWFAAVPQRKAGVKTLSYRQLSAGSGAFFGSLISPQGTRRRSGVF